MIAVARLIGRLVYGAALIALGKIELWILRHKIKLAKAAKRQADEEQRQNEALIIGADPRYYELDHRWVRVMEPDYYRMEFEVDDREGGYDKS